MATVQFNSYRVTEVHSYRSSTGEDVKLITIDLGLGSEPPLPKKIIEVSKLAEIETAFQAYANEAKALGKPVKVSAMMLKGRKPNGFDKQRFEMDLNI